MFYVYYDTGYDTCNIRNVSKYLLNTDVMMTSYWLND